MKRRGENITSTITTSIIMTATLIIYLRSCDHHPDEEDQSDDPESKSRVPLTADGVLFQPSQRVDRDTADVVVVYVAVAVG